jgi:hypothetical protein
MVEARKQDGEPPVSNAMPEQHPARRLGGFLGRWAAATFTLDARSLAVYRIGLGAILIVDCLLRTRDFRLMFVRDGVFPPETLAGFHADPTVWSAAFLCDAAWWGGVVLALEGLAGLALAAGYHTRIATILGWVALVSVIRRTSPSANAGDVWLACQIFWSMFLPLGARWSIDAWRSQDRDPVREPAGAVRSVASAALILQLVAVYLGAGLAKCNPSWFAGDALTHALSVHYYGTPLGMFLGSMPWLARPLQWSVLVGEIGLPLILVALPSAAVRTTIVALSIAFHVAIWLTMSVGLFAAIGIVAWLPLIPAAAWPGSRCAAAPPIAGLGRAASWACGSAGLVAAAAFIHQVTPLASRQLPRPLVAAINLCCLPQEWAMFGGVPAQEQWVYGRGLLADGSIVDLLRDGRPLEDERPAGGFTTLPHHRWHKFLWVLPQPNVRVFAPAAAAAIARDWNARHRGGRQVVTLEIRFGMQQVRNGDGTVRDALLASWPARSATGAGNLERYLDADRFREAGRVGETLASGSAVPAE